MINGQSVCKADGNYYLSLYKKCSPKNVEQRETNINSITAASVTPCIKEYLLKITLVF